MNVSRGTLQRTLYDARKKTAEALCAGMTILIGGGNYELSGRRCGCRDRCRHCRFESDDETAENEFSRDGGKDGGSRNDH
jgi:hypothetical protein